ncbi:hypothetical protein C8F04DRAFT_1392633 [Mycena alexandri]|uniref:F-box domain-containing protein n=1 Tax=Mycena alexandri TaxID=1745969 RepID=A0AAD6T8C5_9AGAR|nr:hypothetical protein C8F04DRAFT_1392633 [Mycena alexandri]
MTMSMASFPRLPPELVELVMHELYESSKDLARCSLVCREWTVCARNHIAFSLVEKTIPEFLQYPKIFIATVCRLRIDAPSFSLSYEPILKMLPAFPRLHDLTLLCSFPDRFPMDLPHLPLLKKLKLSINFSSYNGFVGFVSDLPALQDLTLLDVGRWKNSQPFPILTFKALTLHLPTIPKHVMLSLRSENLTLEFDDILSFPYRKSLSQWMRNMGVHLRCLHLDGDDPEFVVLARADFRCNTNLKHLRLRNAVQLSWRHDAVVSRKVVPLLAAISPHCRLETLILEVDTVMDNHGSKPLADFLVEILDTPQFAAVQQIRLLVNEDTISSCLRAQSGKLLEKALSPLPESSTKKILLLRLLGIFANKPADISVTATENQRPASVQPPSFTIRATSAR